MLNYELPIRLLSDTGKIDIIYNNIISKKNNYLLTIMVILIIILIIIVISFILFKYCKKMIHDKEVYQKEIELKVEKKKKLI